MDCPLCAGALAAVDRRGVEIDRCDACAGVFFDAGEVAEALGIGPDAERRLRRAPTREDSEPHPCPRCFDQLRVIHDDGPAHALHERDVVMVCTGCHGVLLSRRAVGRIAPPRPGQALDWVPEVEVTAQAVDLFATVLLIVGDLFDGWP